MVELHLDKISEKMGGMILQGNPSLLFRFFNIDSRLTVPGELFFAVVAKRNGHDYIPHAREKGASGAVISQDIRVPDRNFALVRVADTIKALQELARAALSERAIKVVGITGSIGKTTTKEFTASLLSRKFRVLKSEGNFNNHLGLALTLLHLLPDHEVAVLEMAMSAPGEIRSLTHISPPDISVITNIHPVHLEFFPSLEDIAYAKREILGGTKEGGIAVLNGDDPLVMKMGKIWKGRTLTFGFSPGCDVRASDIKKMDYEGMTFSLCIAGRTEEVRFPLLSESSISNFLAAAGVAHILGLPAENIALHAGCLKPFGRRGRVHRLANNIVLIDDSYNSNPKALESALREMAALPARRKIAVLGDMLELGKNEREFHHHAGQQVKEHGWDVLVTVGPLGLSMAEGAISSGMNEKNVFSFATSEEAAGRILSLLDEGDLLLVKGSRAIKTEKIVDKIREHIKEA